MRLLAEIIHILDSNNIGITFLPLRVPTFQVVLWCWSSLFDSFLGGSSHTLLIGLHIRGDPNGPVHSPINNSRDHPSSTLEQLSRS
ncbi:hypothetical protein MKW98_025276 [Papaver atlanticum]|uniref:Uncharacterized protein n=1 Tax=Papaver atlanticum TaxID=357466 RepID=A0AAD4S2B2_9MAGN|nr:hypothetical protein MKW98_025276 [Papaver atlanticum]